MIQKHIRLPDDLYQLICANATRLHLSFNSYLLMLISLSLTGKKKGKP